MTMTSTLSASSLAKAEHGVESKHRPKSTPGATFVGSYFGSELLPGRPSCACGGGCPRCVGEYHLPNIQTKLTISTPGDQYEQEADRVAERVMSMAGPELAHPGPGFVSAGIQRKVRDPDAEDEIVEALKATGATVRRQVSDGKMDHDRETEKPRQAKAGTATDRGYKVNSFKNGGQPLSPAVRLFMEPRFGQDFGHVRVHNDAGADAMARVLNAHAFTLGHDVVFAAGQYAPETAAGQRLLAHELSHVVQQSDQPSTIQRKIIVGGRPYTPQTSYFAYLDDQGLGDMKEFIITMHNEGNPPDYNFASYDQMGWEVRIRHAAIQGIEAAHAGCCDYPDSAHPDYLDSTYWERKKAYYFVAKSPLPSGKEASDAIEAIFAPGAGTRLECMSMTFAVEYYSLLKSLGPEEFNKLFPGGAGLEISNRARKSALFTSKKYKLIAVSSSSEILPGDWLYFKNFKDYLTKFPDGAWQGENAIYLGSGLVRGFGVDPMTEENMDKELIKAYTGKPTVDATELAALLAEGGGLQLNAVARLDITTVAP